MRLKPRTGPPSRMIAAQSTFISRLLGEQSVKSGSSTAKPTMLRGAPAPSAPWQAAQVVRKISSPLLAARAGRRRGEVSFGAVVTWLRRWVGERTPVTPPTPTRNATIASATAGRFATNYIDREVIKADGLAEACIGHAL